MLSTRMPNLYCNWFPQLSYSVCVIRISRYFDIECFYSRVETVYFARLPRRRTGGYFNADGCTYRIAVIDTLSVDFSFTASIDSRGALQTIHFSFDQLESDE